MGAEITSITNHRFTSGVVEFHTEYSDGDTEWHPIGRVIDAQLQISTTYVMQHDLGATHNGRYCRCVRVFLRSLKWTLRRMRHSSILGYSSESSDDHSTRKERRHHETANTSTPSNNRTFKYDLEAPKKWGDILRLDKESTSRMWQDAVKRRSGH